MASVFSFTIYRKGLKRALPGLVIWLMISAALLALALLFFPTLVQSGLHETVTEAVGAFPEDLLETFGLSQLPDFTDYTYYLTWVLQIVFLIGCLYAAWLGAVSMVKLESDDTLLMIYAQPVWRCGIVISRLLCRATLLLIYQAVLFLLTQSLGGELVMDPSFGGGLLRVFASFYLVELLYLCIGALLSLFLGHVSHAAAAAFGLLLITVLFGIASMAVPGMSWMGLLSPYGAFPVSTLLVSQGEAVVYWVLAACCLFFSTLVCVRFHFKDMNV